MKIIGKIHTDFPEKFGVPRQAGLAPELVGKIVFEPEYRNPEALRGLEGFSHIWLLWEFSMAKSEEWRPTVRPPRLGGNKRMGVFATRSPFRPNSIGLSCLKILSIELNTPEGPVIVVSGVDMVDGTPIFDIKPYVPMTDCCPHATEGYTAQTKGYTLSVDFPEELLERLDEEKREAAVKILSLDPRPSYIEDSERVYGVDFAGRNIKFRVNASVLSVIDVE